MDLNPVYEAVIRGGAPEAEQRVKELLGKGISPHEIMNDGLIRGMDGVGERFEAGDFFIPEMLIAARAMKAGLAVLKPFLTASGIEPVGKAVIGTVRGDMHDIGKNLVGMMLEGAGFEVVDMGTDVPTERFIEAVRKEQPHILGISALLTTTMLGARDLIERLKEENLRDKVRVIIGGAPVTQDFADQIGADGYADDAVGAGKKCKELLGIR